MTSHGSVAESASTRAVWARSAAEMPVVTPSRASTEIVYAVRSLSLLCGVISGISSRSSMSAGIGTQITPLECRIVNAISSGVALEAAKMMSPSFSRSSSSTTTTALPAAMSAIASSTLSRRTLVVSSVIGPHHLLDVLRDDVDLEVDDGRRSA